MHLEGLALKWWQHTLENSMLFIQLGDDSLFLNPSTCWIYFCEVQETNFFHRGITNLCEFIDCAFTIFKDSLFEYI